MTLLERYIDGWRRHDLRAIVATLTPDCTVIESFGPIYHGHDRVAQWIERWTGEGGRVLDWAIHDLRSAGASESAEWTFHYRWRGEEKRFDGATVARATAGGIAYLREYATTVPLYEWQGEWP